MKCSVECPNWMNITPDSLLPVKIICYRYSNGKLGGWSLKLQYLRNSVSDNVFGYYIESAIHIRIRYQQEWIRKHTLAKCRNVTLHKKLKEYEEENYQRKDKILILEPSSTWNWCRL